MIMQGTITNTLRPIHNRSKSISQLIPYSYQRSILRIASRMTMQSFLLILLIWAAPACSVGKAKDQTSGIDSSGLETRTSGEVYLRYLWPGGDYSDSSWPSRNAPIRCVTIYLMVNSWWQALVRGELRTPANQQKNSAGIAISSEANYLTAYSYGKAGIVWSSP